MDPRLEKLREKRELLKDIREKSDAWRGQGQYLGHSDRVSTHAYNCCLLGYDREQVIRTFDEAIRFHKSQGNMMRAKAYELFIRPFRRIDNEQR